jgi:3-mercaptopyruvate sulfurtransferase SseA
LLKLLGYDRAGNYDGSMGEWANREDTPLEV